MAFMVFDNRADAEKYLKERGFVFVGAPDRWRLVEGSRETYAHLTRSNGLWILSLGQARGR